MPADQESSGVLELEPQAPEDPRRDAQEREQARLEVMDGARAERAGLCKRILRSEIVSNGLDFVPVVGSLKLVAEGIMGDKLTGEELSGKERIIRTAVGTAMTVADFTGWGEAADAVTVVGKSTAFIGRLGTKLAEKGAARGAAIFTKTAEFMAKHPQIVEKAEVFAEAQVRTYLKSKIEEIKTQGNA